MLQAIATERARRVQVAASERQRHAADVSSKLKDKGLVDRVLLAFTEVRPEQWEIEVLKEIASSPGSSGIRIAKAIGKRDVGYINLAVGTLCSNRELYLGLAPASGSRKGEKIFSSLLIDFTPHLEPDGSRWTGWTLKPEAFAALKQLSIVD